MFKQKFIPPKNIRIWVGPFVDKNNYVYSSEREFKMIQNNMDLNNNDIILDIGCGCGRIAVPLLNFLNQNGKYYGVDPAKPLLNMDLN